MTLTTTQQVPEASTEVQEPQYLIFFSSGSPPWCPDCVAALPPIRTVFETNSTSNKAAGYFVMVGERAEWKSPDNRFRKQYGITSIPTITKVVKGREVARLEESDCTDPAKISAFVLQ